MGYSVGLCVGLSDGVFVVGCSVGGVVVGDGFLVGGAGTRVGSRVGTAVGLLVAAGEGFLVGNGEGVGFLVDGVGACVS